MANLEKLQGNLKPSRHILISTRLGMALQVGKPKNLQPFPYKNTINLLLAINNLLRPLMTQQCQGRQEIYYTKI